MNVDIPKSHKLGTVERAILKHLAAGNPWPSSGFGGGHDRLRARQRLRHHGLIDLDGVLTPVGHEEARKS